MGLNNKDTAARDYIIGDLIFGRLVPVAIISIGVLAIVMVGLRQWIAVGTILGAMSLTFYIYASLRRPEIVLLIGLMTSFTIIGYQVGYLLITLQACILVASSFLRRSGFKIDLNAMLWLGIVAIGVLSAINWSDKYVGIKALLHLGIMPLLLYIIVVNCLTDGQCRWLLAKGFPLVAYLVISSTVVVFLVKLSSVESFTSIIDFSKFRRFEIPNNGSNRLAALLAFIAVFLYTSKRLWATTWLKNKLLYILIATAVFLNLVTQSRGGVLNLIVAAIALGFGLYLSGKKIKLNFFAVLIGSITIVLVAKSFIEKLLFRFQIVSIDYSNIFRIVMWRDALMSIKNSPIIGKGPGHVVYSVWGVIHEDPHNVFLRYGVEFGGITIILLGLIFLLPVGKFLEAFKKNRPQAVSLFVLFVPAFLGTLFQSQFDYIINGFSYGALFWTLWALMLRALDDILESRHWELS